MPTYVYKCKTDGVFEIVLKMDDVTPEYPCPDCGMKAKRLWSAPPVIFNSDGFYTTDRKGVTGKSGGDKADQIARQYEAHTGEKAPPPARDVPKSGSEKY